MKYELPEPSMLRSFGNPYAEGYTATQMQSAWDAGRLAGHWQVDRARAEPNSVWGSQTAGMGQAAQRNVDRTNRAL